MRFFAAAAVALAAASAAVAGSQAATERAAPLTATGIRIGNHPGFVRVVVDFSGGRVFGGEEVRASDPNPFPDGKVRLPLFRRGVRTTAAPVPEHGMSARVAQGSGRIVIRLDGAPRRFKYVGYFELHSPERLAIDLYRSAPPTPAAEIRRAPDGCLSLDRFDVGPRSVTGRIGRSGVGVPFGPAG
jgi:hypothetical protein